jgi:hypothetical protein
MNVTEIMKDLFFVQRGYLNSNHFGYRSEHPVLMDTVYMADVAVTEHLIQDAGVALAETNTRKLGILFSAVILSDATTARYAPQLNPEQNL